MQRLWLLTRRKSKPEWLDLKNAPAPAKRDAGFGALLGLVLLVGFLASAFAGHVTWGRAALNGIVQFMLMGWAGIAVQDRRIWGWWVLLAFCLMRLWWGLGHALRLLRVAWEGGLSARGRELWFDLAGTTGFVVAGILLFLLFHKVVRAHVNWPLGKPAEARS